MTKEQNINVKVKISSKKESVKYENGTYTVYTNTPAKENKANIAVISLLSKHLNIPKRNILVKKGLKSRNKVLTILYQEK